MYLIVIAWCYVTVMMAVAEASSPQGSILGAIITFALYGLLPMAIVVYIFGTPERKRRLKAQKAAEQRAYDAEQAAKAAATDALPHAGCATDTATPSALPDTSGHAAGAPEHLGIAPVREKE